MSFKVDNKENLIPNSAKNQDRPIFEHVLDDDLLKPVLEERSRIYRTSLAALKVLIHLASRRPFEARLLYKRNLKHSLLLPEHQVLANKFINSKIHFNPNYGNTTYPPKKS